MSMTRLRGAPLAALATALALICARPAAASGVLKLYVSPRGDDAWSGRLERPALDGTDGPLASLAGARDAIRRLRKKHGRLLQAVTVEFADGTYCVGATVVFKPEDSGTKNFPITYGAAPGAKPVISGARAITGWKKDASSGLWSARLPKVGSGRWYFRQLFVDGVRYARAREPNEKDFWFRAAAFVVEGGPRAIMEWGDLRRWRAGDDVEAVLLRTWDMSRYRVTSVDWKNLVVRFEVPDLKHAFDWWKHDRRIYFENSLSFLDAPGEWFLDRAENVVYLKPLGKHDPARARVVAPVVDRLLRLVGTAKAHVRHLRFRGLTFSGSAWTLPEKGYRGRQAAEEVGAAVEGDFLESCSFEDSRFEHLGRYGLWLRRGCRDNRIARCEFVDLGAGAVKIGENVRQSVAIEHETTHNEVSDCHIYRCGRVWKGAVGIWVGPASYTRVARNHIHELPYSGVSVGWTWAAKPSGAHHNVIEYNHIHDVMQSMSDGAGIYTLGLQPGTVLRNNVIHDNPGWEPMRWANGIYHDAGSSEILDENNLVFRVGRWALCLGMNERNVVRNNIFAMPGGDLIILYKGRDNLLERNIFVGNNRMFHPVSLPEAVRARDNVYFRPSGGAFEFLKGVTLEKWRAMTGDVRSVEADPRFADLKNGDFSLKKDSPALKLGFKPFKLPVIGPPRFDYSKRVSAAMRRKGPNRMTRIPVPRLVVHRPTSAIAIDGRLDEKAWKDIEPVPLAETKKGKPHDPPLHYARVACDGRNLYVAISSVVPPGERLRADGKTWDRHDWAVVCFQGVWKTHATPVYCARGWAKGDGQMLIRTGTSREKVPAALKRGFRFASTRGKKRWIGEWKIPLTAARIRLSTVEELRFNLGVRRADARIKDRKWSFWIYTGKEAWDVRHAGVLVFERRKKKAGRSAVP